MDDSWLSEIILLSVLVLCAFYFAAAETAFASVSRIRIKTIAERGDRRAQNALRVLDDIDKAITTILIGTNIAHIASASIVTLTVTRLWGLSFVAVATAVTTVVVFFVGEMLPKTIAKKYPERISLATAFSLSIFMRLFTPISYILTAFGTAIASLTKSGSEVTVTEDELYDIIESIKDEGSIDPDRGGLVHSALMFADVTVENIMTPRVDVAAMDVQSDCAEILEFIKAHRHSRIPVYEQTIDRVIGVLQIRKYIREYLRQGNSIELLPLIDEAYFVHQRTNIDELLPEMSLRGLNMAIVLDSYGGTCGIVTIEDILEELVGEIWDEDDVVVESFVRLDDGSVELSASLSLQETCEALSIPEPEDETLLHTPLLEWAFEQFDLMPSEGDSFFYEGMEFVISKMNQYRIVSLAARPLPKNEGGGNL